MSYRDRRLARAERLRGWAEKREARSAAGFASARRIADGIPMGQPILIGHHSERHHRRDIGRIDAGMRAGIDHADKAREMAGKADEIERQADHAIYSDDVDAVERLTEKIAGLEAQREHMKAENAAFTKSPEGKAALKAEPSAYQRSCMRPHQAYELQNLGGNITRARERLRILTGTPKPRTAYQERCHAGDAPEPPTAPQGATATERAGLVVRAEMTTPSRAGKAPRPVWTVRGNFADWRAQLLALGGNWYRGAFSFWDDPSKAIEAACLKAEASATPATPTP